MRRQRGAREQPRHLIVWLAAAGTLLGGPAAFGAVTRAHLVVVGLEPKDRRAALELEMALWSFLEQDARFELVEPSGAYAPSLRTTLAEQLKAGRDAVEAVRAAIDGADYKQAKLRAEAALATLGGGDFRVLRPVILELWLELAVIKRRLALEDGGRLELKQALVVEPGLEIPRSWNTSEKAWFRRAREAVTASRGQSVVFDCEGEPIWVWVDGRRLGLTPVALADVRPGRHFLTFEAPGTVPVHRSELLGGLERLTVEPTETPEGRAYRSLRASLVAGFRRDDPQPAAEELLASAPADELLAVAVGDGPGARAYRYGAGGQVPTTIVALAAIGPVAEAIAQLLDQPLRPLATSQLTTDASNVRPLAPTAPRSWTPGVVLFVTAAAAIAVGTTLILEGRAAATHARKTIPQNETARYETALDGADAMVGSGIAVLGGATLSAGLGLVLIW